MLWILVRKELHDNLLMLHLSLTSIYIIVRTWTRPTSPR